MYDGEMAFTFDSLSYAEHLRNNGVPQDQAEAHAEAVKMHTMNELDTKEDLRTALETQPLGLSVWCRLTRSEALS
jgi:hypothetical protein